MKNFITKSYLLAFHLFALAGIIWTPFYASNITITVSSMLFIGLGITIGYHRYFSHNSFKTSRLFQFILGFWGSLAMQGGVLFWSLVHRHHHRHSDKPTDVHSPKNGFWHSHIGWMGHPETTEALKDDVAMKWNQYPELCFLERFFLLPPLLMMAALFGVGMAIGGYSEAFRLLAWGYLLPIVVQWHITWSINSLTHVVGKRRFATKDDSRNNWVLGILALGEGWHNNHHRFPTSVRQGMFWYEVDVSYYVILLFKKLGLVWQTLEYPDKLKQLGQQSTNGNSGVGSSEHTDAPLQESHD